MTTQTMSKTKAALATKPKAKTVQPHSTTEKVAATIACGAVSTVLTVGNTIADTANGVLGFLGAVGDGIKKGYTKATK